MINLNTVDSIKNNNFLPFPGVFVHNYGESEVIQRDSVVGSWDFFGIDTYEFYKKNLKRQPKDWYYRNNKIKYTLNSYGYRTKEFEDIDWKNSIVMFGCSHIFGTGNDDNHTIPYFLEQKSGIPVINLGAGGSSIQFCLHNSLMLYKKYGPPKLVIYCWTGITRHLIYQKDFVLMNTKFEDIYEHPPEAIAAVEESTGSVLKSVHAPKVLDHLIPFNMVNVELIKNLWKDKCPLYEFSTFPTTSKLLGCELYQPIPNDYARDLAHYGRHSNKLFAEKIYSNLKNAKNL
jgi:hypothetical protein